MSITQSHFPHSIESTELISLKNKGDWTIQGHSKAGERTSFRIQPLNILLDIGMLPTKAPKAVLLTHCHVDHTWNLPNLFGGIKKNLEGSKKIPVYFPAQGYLGLTKLLEAACVLTYPKETFTEEQVWDRHFLEPHPIVVGDNFTIDKVQVEVLQAVHVVHSVGYGFFNIKSKLKPEFQDLDGQTLKALREKGTPITNTIMMHEFAFYCDSTIHNLANYDQWKSYPSIVVECTGYPDIYNKETTALYGHTHLEDLVPYISHFPGKNWFLIHSSVKMTRELLEQYQHSLNQQFPDTSIKIISPY